MSDSPLSSDEEVLVLALKTEEEKKKRKNNMGVWFMRFKRGRRRVYNTVSTFKEWQHCFSNIFVIPRQPSQTPHISRLTHAQSVRRFRTFKKNIVARILGQFGSDLKLRFCSDLKQCALSGSKIFVFDFFQTFRFRSDTSFLRQRAACLSARI